MHFPDATPSSQENQSSYSSHGRNQSPYNSGGQPYNSGQQPYNSGGQYNHGGWPHHSGRQQYDSEGPQYSSSSQGMLYGWEERRDGFGGTVYIDTVNNRLR